MTSKFQGKLSYMHMRIGGRDSKMRVLAQTTTFTTSVVRQRNR